MRHLSPLAPTAAPTADRGADRHAEQVIASGLGGPAPRQPRRWSSTHLPGVEWRRQGSPAHRRRAGPKTNPRTRPTRTITTYHHGRRFPSSSYHQPTPATVRRKTDDRGGPGSSRQRPRPGGGGATRAARRGQGGRPAQLGAGGDDSQQNPRSNSQQLGLRAGTPRGAGNTHTHERANGGQALLRLSLGGRRVDPFTK